MRSEMISAFRKCSCYIVYRIVLFLFFFFSEYTFQQYIVIVH